MACVYVYVIILAILGPEYKGRTMRAEGDHDLEEATGRERIENVTHQRPGSNGHHSSDEEKTEKV